MSLLIQSFEFIFLINLLGFLIAYFFQSDKLTDITYSLCFLLATSFAFFKTGHFSFLKIILFLIIAIWAIRLGIYLLVRIFRIKKDDRFDVRRKSFWAFGSFWALQALSVSIIVMPVILFLSKSQINTASFSVGFFCGFGLCVAVLGLYLETIADAQKFRFKNKEENKGKFISTGLWSISRHPNYLGEILFWWGIFIFIAPTLAGWEWLSIISPLWITFLLLKVSGIPILEKKADQNYGHLPAYQNYKIKTPILFPRFGKK